MIIIIQLKKYPSLRRSLGYAEISYNKWYHKKIPRNISIDKTVFKIVQRISSIRLTYGTRHSKKEYF